MVEIGDRVFIRGRHVDDSDRSGVIVAVLGRGGTAPYRARFQNGQERLIFPGPDATITTGDALDPSGGDGPPSQQS